MNELRLCIHCGGEIKVSTVMSRYKGNPRCAIQFYARCLSCGIRTDCYDNEEQALEVISRRASPWISVKDRLPEIGQRILIAKDKAQGFIGDYSVYLWEKGLENFITHWMPIPPLEENNA